MKKQLPPLTSLRFFAAFAIVIFHMGIWRIFGFTVPAIAAQGVTFFFVLSGFILTYNYGPELDHGRFYTSRIARIWPLHIATFLAVFLFQNERATGAPVLAGVANVFLVQDWLPLHSLSSHFNGVSWSVSAELFFYLLFPLLLRSRLCLITSFAIPILLVAAIEFMIAVPSDPNWREYYTLAIYKWPPIRMLEFSLGIVVARFYMRNRNGLQNAAAASVLEVSAILLIVAAYIYHTDIMRFLNPQIALSRWVYFSGGAPLFAACILVFAYSKGAISRLLTLPPFVLLGEISFSMYMIHPFVIRPIARSTLPTEIGAIASVGLVVVLTVICSYLTWAIIERPFRSVMVSAYANRFIAVTRSAS